MIRSHAVSNDRPNRRDENEIYSNDQTFDFPLIMNPIANRQAVWKTLKWRIDETILDFNKLLI